MDHMRELWIKWRSKLYSDHVKPCKGNVEAAIKNVPPMMNKDDWAWCVTEVFFSDEYQKKSKNNTINRLRKKLSHHIGSKPTRQIIHELIEEFGEEPDFLTIFFNLYKQGDSLKDHVAIERHEHMKKKLEENPNATTIDLVEVAFGKQNHGKVAGLGGGVKPKDINGKSSKNEELLAKLRQVEEEKASLQKRVEDNEVAARAEAERQKQATDELKAEMDEMNALLRGMCNRQQM
ncbi:hypothetical protein LINPERHAP1_LOCUS33551, partial [Linum perenne]